MAVRVLVANRTRRIVAEIEPEVGPISWRLNEVGKATFSLAKTDPKAVEDHLRFGNFVLFQFDNGLPDWGGMIEPPRTWTDEGIECTAYSGEYLLGLRQTDRGRYFSGATVGYIYQQLIVEATAGLARGIVVGEVWGGGAGHSPDFHFKNLLAIMQESVCRRLEDVDFTIRPAEDAGYVTFTAHLYERRGTDRSGSVALLEGQNVALVRLKEQGPILNAWDLAGEGTGWGADRLVSHAEDAGSIGDYGLRQDSQMYADTSEQATLDGTAENLLAESAQPHNILTLQAVDLAPAAFADYDVGDSVRVVLHSYGFGGYDHTVRVLTREYDPGSGRCALVVEEEDV